MLNQELINKQFEVVERGDWNNLRIARLNCLHCNYSVFRGDVHNKLGCHVKYGGMRAKMIKHIHLNHPNIWETLKIPKINNPESSKKI